MTLGPGPGPAASEMLSTCDISEENGLDTACRRAGHRACHMAALARVYQPIAGRNSDVAATKEALFRARDWARIKDSLLCAMKGCDMVAAGQVSAACGQVEAAVRMSARPAVHMAVRRPAYRGPDPHNSPGIRGPFV